MKMFQKLFCVFLVTISIISIGQCFKIQPRIMYGRSSERGQFPFYALLKVLVDRPNGNPIEGICGGTLLDNQFILTSANCIHNKLKIQLDLGSWKMNETQEEGRISYSISPDQVYIHPEFDEKKLVHDMALIKLREPVTFSDVIQPVSFPKECTMHKDIKFTAIGNGYIINGFYELPATLRYTSANLTSNEVCLQVFDRIDEENQFCAGQPDGSVYKTICNGDLGGPLIHETEQTLYGVSTLFYVYACEISPGLFTSVFNYYPWISHVTSIHLPNCQ